MSILLLKAYAQRDYSKLLTKIIVDKNGKMMTVYIRPDDFISSLQLSYKNLEKKMMEVLAKRKESFVRYTILSKELAEKDQHSKVKAKLRERAKQRWLRSESVLKEIRIKQDALLRKLKGIA